MEKPEQPASKTSDNHGKAPQCAEFVKNMREAFGEENVIVSWVKEGEIELGAPIDKQ